MWRYGPVCTSRPPDLGSGRMLKLPGRFAVTAQTPSAAPAATSMLAAWFQPAAPNGSAIAAISPSCSVTMTTERIAIDPSFGDGIGFT